MRKIIAIAILIMSLHIIVQAETVTLDQAINIALEQTSRGQMLQGNLEVAEQNYFAQKINFYVPEISINGTLPSYQVDESYRYFGPTVPRSFLATKDLSYTSFIQLNQSLITGGDLVVKANLLSRKSEDPFYNDSLGTIYSSEQDTRRGFLSFSFTQPLLKPSDSKYELHNTRDDFEIAKLTMIEDRTKLKSDVIEAYIGLLRSTVKHDMNNAAYKSAKLTAEIDSMKYQDGVISEEELLLSKSAALDAELTMFESNTETEEKLRELTILLDWDPDKELKPVEPDTIKHFEENVKSLMRNSWDKSVPVMKAEHNYEKAKRDADYKSGGHGLTGDLEASYSTGEEKTRPSGTTDWTNNPNKGWEVAVNFSLPLWDGGSSGAQVKSAKLQAEQSKFEYNQAKQQARADIISLINQTDVSYRRLDIMRKQIDLADNRLKIAESRFKDGQISEVELLTARVEFLSKRDAYLEELSQYLINRVTLEGKFINE